MDERAKQGLLEGLKKAIMAEGDGYHFYRMAAENTQDDKGKRVFDILAQEELKHARYLKTQYRSLLEVGRLDDQTTLGDHETVDEVNPIFSESLKARLKDAHVEISSLSVAMQLEENSMRHYRELSEATEDKIANRFFSELALWEQGHYEILARQLEQLKEEYWSLNRFSPF